MAHIEAFRAYRPQDDILEQVAVKSSDLGSKRELIEAIKSNPLSYLNLTNAHYLEGKEDDTSEAFAHAQAYIQRMFDKNHLKQDEQNSFYIYRQTNAQRSCTGIIGKADIEEYDNNTIKKHELTRTSSEHVIADLFRNTRVLGEPVLLSYRDRPAINQLVQSITQSEPAVRFHSRMGELHELWLLTDKEQIKSIVEHVKGIESLFIMDGHHRMAALSNLHSFKPEEKGRYFMANLVPESELHIGPFHRKISRVSIEEKDLLLELSHIFDIQSLGSDLSIYNPGKRNEFGLLMNGVWYSLSLRNPHHQLDVTLLEAEILAPVFGILNTQTDERVSFIKNIDEMDVIEDMKNEDHSVLFTLYPCSFEEIRTVSEQGSTMPPKSTYIQPRSRPGLVIQKFL